MSAEKLARELAIASQGYPDNWGDVEDFAGTLFDALVAVADSYPSVDTRCLEIAFRVGPNTLGHALEHLEESHGVPYIVTAGQLDLKPFGAS